MEKKKRKGSPKGLTRKGLEIVLTPDELQMLRDYPYEEPGMLLDEEDIQVGQELIARGLLERDPSTDHLVIRRTELGEEAQRPLTHNGVKKIIAELRVDMSMGKSFNLIDYCVRLLYERAVIEYILRAGYPEEKTILILQDIAAFAKEYRDECRRVLEKMQGLRTKLREDMTVDVPFGVFPHGGW